MTPNCFETLHPTSFTTPEWCIRKKLFLHLIICERIKLEAWRSGIRISVESRPISSIPFRLPSNFHLQRIVLSKNKK